MSSSTLCVCGNTLTQQKASECYEGYSVACDQCGADMRNDDLVFHCGAESNELTHPGGFDLCRHCAQTLQLRSNNASTLSQFLVIPSAVSMQMLGKRDAFVRRSLYYWAASLASVSATTTSPLFQSLRNQISSLTAFLQQTQNNKDNMIEFNNKPNQSTSSKPAVETSSYGFSRRRPLLIPTTKNRRKYEESMSTKFNPLSSIVVGGSVAKRRLEVTSFPALVAQIKEDVFGAHGKLKECMDAFQSNEQNDIHIRRMTEKKNANKKWAVQGLIDPDKHLSTLDHSLNLRTLKMLNTNGIVNYHQWIPSVFHVNEQATECKLLSEIPNLNAYKYGNTLYKFLEQLFLFQLDQFENVTGYNLRNVPLQVVVKAQDYQLNVCSEEDSYLGNMHREGLYEDIAAVGLYYYHIDKHVKGGELEISSVIKAEDTGDRKNVTVLRETSVAVKEGTSVVFNNKMCYHRVSKLHGHGSRKIIAFILITPNHRYPAIDARFVVVNWKYHAEHLLFRWLKEEGLMNGYEWILDVLCEYVVGDRKYIEDATEFYNECRRAYSRELTFDESSITSRGTDLRRIHRLD